jgi:hypothetical protein
VLGAVAALGVVSTIFIGDVGLPITAAAIAAFVVVRPATQGRQVHTARGTGTGRARPAKPVSRDVDGCLRGPVYSPPASAARSGR